MQGMRGKRGCCCGWFAAALFETDLYNAACYVQAIAGCQFIFLVSTREAAACNFGETDGGLRNRSEVVVAEAEAVQTTQVGPESCFSTLMFSLPRRVSATSSLICRTQVQEAYKLIHLLRIQDHVYVNNHPVSFLFSYRSKI
jgi:hypothetical protein